MNNVCLIRYNCFTVTQIRQVFGSCASVRLDSCLAVTAQGATSGLPKGDSDCTKLHS